MESALRLADRGGRFLSGGLLFRRLFLARRSPFVRSEADLLSVGQVLLPEPVGEIRSRQGDGRRHPLGAGPRPARESLARRGGRLLRDPDDDGGRRVHLGASGSGTIRRALEVFPAGARRDGGVGDTALSARLPARIAPAPRRNGRSPRGSSFRPVWRS